MNKKGKSVYQDADNYEKLLIQESEMGIAPKCQMENRSILIFQSYEAASRVRQIF